MTTAVVEQKKEEVTQAEPIMGRILSMEDVFAVDDRDYRIVEIPEWKGSVRIRSLDAAEALEFAKKMKVEKERENAMLQIVSLCTVDANGNRIFASPEAFKKLQNRNMRVLARIQNEAMEHNGFNEDAKEKDDNAKKD